MKKQKNSKKEKIKVKEIKSKIKIREIKENDKKKPEIEKKIQEEERTSFDRFFSQTKNPILEKISRVEEPKLEQIASMQTFKKKAEEERGTGYMDIKSDYANAGKRTKERENQYTEAKTDYSSFGDEKEKERLGQISGLRQADEKMRKSSNRESDDTENIKYV
jgi:hypothetical protein